MSVIDFAQKRLERSPHNAGIGKCLNCHHEWAAVCPSDVDWLECPECGLSRGLMKFPYSREGAAHWTCSCGNDLFHVTPEGVYCPNCADWQQGF